MTTPVQGSKPSSQADQVAQTQPSVPAGIGAAPTTMTSAPKEKGYILSTLGSIADRLMQFFKNIYHFILSCFGYQSQKQTKQEVTEPKRHSLN